MTSEEARRIAQDFLDRQGEATVSGDLEATLDWCDLPCTLESMERRVVATTREQLRAVCAAFIAGLKTQRTTHMVRHCLEAKFKDENTLWATYETRYVRDNTQLSGQPYFGFVVLLHKDGRWKISSMQFAVNGSSPPNLALGERLEGGEDG